MPGGPVEPGAGSDVGLNADDRLHACFLSLLVEVDRTVENAVVRDRDGGLLELGGPLHDICHPRRTVEHRKLSMQMEVSEGH